MIDCSVSGCDEHHWNHVGIRFGFILAYILEARVAEEAGTLIHRMRQCFEVHPT